MGSMVVIAAITAQNTFTGNVALHGMFNVSVSGTFTATVTVQRSFDSGSTWLDMPTAYTSATQATLTEPERDVLYRIGVKAGGYTSGTANVRLSQ
ncbi:MAG: hypothetical protein GY851_09910 [bacterium]|nr:hypothetical protein [bacterium]